MSVRAMRMAYGTLVLAIILACAPIAAPNPVVVPTFDPNSINTTIAQTAESAATQTALVIPTATETVLPTVTPSITPTATVTFIFILFTPTVPSSTPEPKMSNEKFSCVLLSQIPADNSHLALNEDFEMRWHIMNNGTAGWDGNSMDYRYKSGDKIHTTAAYDLQGSVASGSQTDIRVAMKAPGSGGTYSTTWMIHSGQNEF